jgi:hypothetical protein
LPRFVERIRFNIKRSLSGRIRMETPVLYFYTPRDMTVNVTVRFRQGVVTEWFPHAVVTPASVDSSTLGRPGFSSSIAWRNVKVSPGGNAEFPVDASGSRYYAARQTDASPLQSGSEKEKFLFYRGVGDFEPPVQATVAVDRRVVIKNPSGEPVGDVILFENAGGTMDYQVRHAVSGQVTFDPPAGDGELAPPVAALERILVAHGLYPKEAQAMINTWRDLWFGEGTRLLYVVPRATIDAVLPLEITPIPSELTRVLIGRVELASDRRRAPVRTGR